MRSVFVLTALKTNNMMIKSICDFLLMTRGTAPPETIDQAVGELDFVLEDTGYLLNHAFNRNISMAASRLPKRPERPLTPKEALEVLETTLGIMQAEVEALLEEKPGFTEEQYEAIKRRRDYVIAMMGFQARFYKAYIQGKDPTAWTSDIEKRFDKFLKIKPIF